MSDFAVEYGVLDEYAAAMAARTQEAANVFSSTRVDSPQTAMPGGVADLAAGLLQGRYEAATRRVNNHLSEHPRKLAESAANYREAENSGIGMIQETFGVG